ncbi:MULTISPECIES: hypothetical protein [Klebsiella]|uniref:hypothetical protein n=1 Tax=Klebsiella TaxID=570 RepID=UPI0025A41C8F|nr:MULTISPECIES: hypothetical protein [Klebsiella]MDM8021946.1 hypothetical protein [Klebsiella pneumoniae]MDM8038135.1 hypothetical protein [Klebsiella pneumoniae]MDM8043359.1 hypothetical protein [Klebsiella quasipneumoniae]MDM8059018.1 hypothetical protein [Klebsiella aerogenes]MDM8075331.1 hypothetical protein [Klebsiella pneumoniae]
MRDLILQLSKSSIYSTKPTGTCMYGSILVSMLLEKFSGVRTRIAGGDGVGDGGIVTPEGMKGHYWVVANVHGMHFIVDITADQFGMDSIIYKGLKDAPEYVEGHQAVVDEHVADSFQKLFQSYSSEDTRL